MLFGLIFEAFTWSERIPSYVLLYTLILAGSGTLFGTIIHQGNVYNCTFKLPVNAPKQAAHIVQFGPGAGVEFGGLIAQVVRRFDCREAAHSTPRKQSNTTRCGVRAPATRVVVWIGRSRGYWLVTADM